MKMHRLFVVQAVALLSSVCWLAGRPALTETGGPPTTRKLPVVDDYRWLESWDDPEVKAWSDAQNAYARSILDRLPGVDAIRQQVTAIRKIEIPSYVRMAYVGSELFALKLEPPQQQAVLVVMPSEDEPASARVVTSRSRRRKKDCRRENGNAEEQGQEPLHGGPAPPSRTSKDQGQPDQGERQIIPVIPPYRSHERTAEQKDSHQSDFSCPPEGFHLLPVENYDVSCGRHSRFKHVWSSFLGARK